MKNKELYKKALCCFNELKEKVENYQGTLEQLCDELGGHNFEDNLFDVNYAWICATVYKKNKGFVLDNYIELWDDENFEFIGTFAIEELKKIIQ